jgi:hypothetical protein
MVVAQVNDAIGADTEIILEVPEDMWIGARPRVHGLLVITDGEDVTVLLRQPTNDRVLDRIQILELVDEDHIPARTDLVRDIVNPEQLRRLQHQRVEIGDVSLRHGLLVSLVVPLVADAQRVPSKPISRKGFQHFFLLIARDAQPSQHCFLLGLVGDAEARLQIDFLPEFSQQPGAEGVNGAALHPIDPVPQLALQTLGDLAGGFVGESKDADSRWIDLELLDQISDALDQTESFSGAGTGENQQRLRCRLDGLALTRRWYV